MVCIGGIIMSKQKQKKKKGIVNLVALLVIIAVVGGAVFIFAQDKAVAYAKTYTLQEAVKSYLPDGIDEEQVEEVTEQIQESMSEEDQDAVDEIIENHITPSTVTKAVSYATSGDTSGLKSYFQNMLTEEEQQKLYEIYSTYGDKALEILEENGIDISDYQ